MYYYSFCILIGLCRTCEVFGVSELVIASRNTLEEKEFKSLSVTAQKWLKIKYSALHNMVIS